MNQKIFIIEDDANILYGLQAKFRVEGFEVEIENGSSSIEEALNKIKFFKPKYVILDLILPKLDGFEVARKIQEEEETKNIGIFAFTSLSDQDSKERGIKFGVDYYLLKSELNVDELVEKVKKIIKNKQKI